MILERAHEAAIFGHSSVPLPSILGTDPAEGKDKLVSSVDTVKQLLHHSVIFSNKDYISLFSHMTCPLL